MYIISQLSSMGYIPDACGILRKRIENLPGVYVIVVRREKDGKAYERRAVTPTERERYLLRSRSRGRE